MRCNLLPLILSLFLSIILLTASTSAAPVAEAEVGSSPQNVPVGSTRFARSIPELIAEKRAKEQRALAAREGRKEMGLW